MPNWCDNFVKVQGDKEIIADFVGGLWKGKTEVWHPSLEDGEKMLIDIVKIADSYYPTPRELENIQEGRNQTGAQYWWETYDDDTEVPETVDAFLEKITKALDEQEYKNLKITEMVDLIFKYGYFSSFDWRINNWGTKWGDMETRMRYVDELDYIEFEFRTAWSPPVNLFLYLSKKFELDVTMNYWEEAGQEGQLRIVNGIIHKDEVAFRDIYNEEYMSNLEEE